MADSSLGNFSKHVLLTGAGWSRNWGGLLASEVWEALIGHQLVQSNQRLHSLLLEEPSFEVALGRMHVSPFTREDRQHLEQGLLEAFMSIDREISRPDHEPWINIYKVQEMLFRFCGQGFDTGYLFTLNQDLFFERKLYNEHVYFSPSPALTAIQGNPNQRWFTGNIGPYSDDFTIRPDPEEERSRLQGHLNVIKLHGSFNWRTGDGRNLMVVGTEKTTQIASLPLLVWYADVFKQVLTAGDVRLMIAGYGFGDAHVNAVIAEAIEIHGLKVLIWDTGPNLKDRILDAPHGRSIWSGLISTVTRTMTEVFPGNQAETEEYRRIKESFFV